MEKEKFTVYCNNINIGITRFDLTLELGSTNKDGLEEIGSVILSPNHAKVLAHILQENVRVYESLFGEIIVKEPSQEELQGDGIKFEPFK